MKGRQKRGPRARHPEALAGEYVFFMDGEEVYLPDLQILPGKVEFYFLPANAQSLVILPLQSAGGAVVISTNQAKVLRLSDLQKIRAVCALVDTTF